MPYFGLLPFLLTITKDTRQRLLGFNALLRASSFSTKHCVKKVNKQITVSMPYFGLLPFLPKNNKERGELMKVSMPYFGLLPFLRIFKSVFAPKVNLFQCPTSGFFLFYSAEAQASAQALEVFQCPTSGFFLFYTRQRAKRSRSSDFVSMPYFGLLPFLHYVSTAIDFTGFPASIL